MKFEFFDPNLPLSMNILLVAANVINLVYNIPQIVHTYRKKTTADFSAWFLFLRILGNTIWVVYAIYVSNLLLLINNIVTVLASVFVAWYKVRELLASRYKVRELLATSRLYEVNNIGFRDNDETVLDVDADMVNLVTFDLHEN